jgi:peptide/nickel transport system substrate-binding protein
VNLKTLNDRVYQGKAIMSSTIFPSGILKTAVAGVTYDATKAKALLAAAKASSGWDGSIRLLCYAEPLAQAQALAIQAELNAVGFKVTIDAAPSVSAFTNDVYVKYDYDLAVSGLVVTPSNPWAQLNGNISGPLSTFGVDDPSLNAALSDLHAADTQAKTTAALNKLQLAWNTVQPGAVLSVGQYTDVWSNKVHGVIASSNNTLLYGKAWLTK